MDPSEPLLRDENKKTNNLQKIAEINQTFKERDLRQYAKKSGHNYIDLKNAPLNQDALQLTNWEEIQKAQAIPFDLSGTVLKIACVDPSGESCEQFQKHFEKIGYQIEKYICSPEGIESTKHFFENLIQQTSTPLKTTTKEDEQISNWKQVFQEYQSVFDKGTGPEMMNQMDLISVRFRASDVHFQPEENKVLIRMRRDGQLYEVFTVSHKQYLLLSGEVKRAAGLKANVKNIPQDGEYEFMANERKISVRVSSLPSKYGESLVMRILDAKNAVVDLNELGYSESNKQKITQRLENNRGLLLVTGPTGSGKTSTLYSCLHYVNQPDKKIITLEDPIEYELQNTVQSEISEGEGYTFASGLRSILRQDPDIIMVGEIRDKEAAEIALQASLTGHLVLSTVHSNDALSTIPRLLNMGLKPYILAAGLELIIAQRLVRKVCQACKIPTEPKEATQQELQEVIQSLQQKAVSVPPELKVFEAKGCDQCAETGYNGRIAIAEVLAISDQIRRLMLAGESISAMLQQALREGFVTLKEDGILKVLEGETTLEEVRKVLL